MVARCGREVIEPTLKALSDAGSPYKGVLYAGIILTDEGPKVLEFNCRFGDPETQVVLPMLTIDMVDLMLLSATGKLGEMMTTLNLDKHDWKRISRTGSCATVILASQGYPGSYAKGKLITNIPSEREDLVTFHAGTKWENNQVVTSGGRVLAVTALADELKDSLESAYKAADEILFDGKYFRRDIGWRALEAE
jgi:phosphoribosylamine--glycine ligase